MTGLSGQTTLDFTNNGLIDSSQFNGGQISRNFEVDNKDYKLSLNRNENNKVSVEIDSNESFGKNLTNVIDVIYVSENKFKAILPDGSETISNESGNVIEITNSSERIDIFSPTNTDKINLNNFSISLYICALFIMIFMIFDDS